MCCPRPDPVYSVGLRVFSVNELNFIRSCIHTELKRHFGGHSEVEDVSGAAIDAADVDGSGGIQGPEVVKLVEASLPEGLLGDKRVREVVLRLAWCM